MRARKSHEFQEALQRLQAKGLIATAKQGFITTRRWQAAMTAAALRLMESGDSGEDIRVPIATALVAIYGDDIDDQLLITLIEAMMDIEAAEMGIGERRPGGESVAGNHPDA